MRYCKKLAKTCPKRFLGGDLQKPRLLHFWYTYRRELFFYYCLSLCLEKLSFGRGKCTHLFAICLSDSVRVSGEGILRLAIMWTRRMDTHSHGERNITTQIWHCMVVVYPVYALIRLMVWQRVLGWITCTFQRFELLFHKGVLQWINNRKRWTNL